jgi:hypothetical protein
MREMVAEIGLQALKLLSAVSSWDRLPAPFYEQGPALPRPRARFSTNLRSIKTDSKHRRRWRPGSGDWREPMSALVRSSLENRSGTERLVQDTSLNLPAGRSSCARRFSSRFARHPHGKRGWQRWWGAAHPVNPTYHALPGNLKRLDGFRAEISCAWWQSLMRRIQKHRMPWTNGQCLLCVRHGGEGADRPGIPIVRTRRLPTDPNATRNTATARALQGYTGTVVIPAPWHRILPPRR